MSNIAISKLPSKGGFEARLDALERAENAYNQAKGQTKQQVIPLQEYLLDDKDELIFGKMFVDLIKIFSLYRSSA